MILDDYKYDLNTLYLEFKNKLIEIIYNVEIDEDLTDNDRSLFNFYISKMKSDFEKT